MAEIVDIPISDLLLDPGNPRFKEEPRSQQETALELAEKHGEHIVELAGDVVDHGVDPAPFNRSGTPPGLKQAKS